MNLYNLTTGAYILRTGTLSSIGADTKSEHGGGLEVKYQSGLTEAARVAFHLGERTTSNEKTNLGKAMVVLVADAKLMGPDQINININQTDSEIISAIAEYVAAQLEHIVSEGAGGRLSINTLTLLRNMCFILNVASEAKHESEVFEFIPNENVGSDEDNQGDFLGTSDTEGSKPAWESYFLEVLAVGLKEQQSDAQSNTSSVSNRLEAPAITGEINMNSLTPQETTQLQIEMRKLFEATVTPKLPQSGSPEIANQSLRSTKEIIPNKVSPHPTRLETNSGDNSTIASKGVTTRATTESRQVAAAENSTGTAVSAPATTSVNPESAKLETEFRTQFSLGVYDQIPQAFKKATIEEKKLFLKELKPVTNIKERWTKKKSDLLTHFGAKDIIYDTKNQKFKITSNTEGINEFEVGLPKFFEQLNTDEFKGLKLESKFRTQFSLGVEDQIPQAFKEATIEEKKLFLKELKPVTNIKERWTKKKSDLLTHFGAKDIIYDTKDKKFKITLNTEGINEFKVGLPEFFKKLNTDEFKGLKLESEFRTQFSLAVNYKIPRAFKEATIEEKKLFLKELKPVTNIKERWTQNMSELLTHFVAKDIIYYKESKEIKILTLSSGKYKVDLQYFLEQLVEKGFKDLNLKYSLFNANNIYLEQSRNYFEQSRSKVIIKFKGGSIPDLELEESEFKLMLKMLKENQKREEPKELNLEEINIIQFCYDYFEPSNTDPKNEALTYKYLTNKTVETITKLLVTEDNQEKTLKELGIKGVKKVYFRDNQIYIEKENNNDKKEDNSKKEPISFSQLLQMTTEGKSNVKIESWNSEWLDKLNRNGSYDNSNKYELIKRLIALSLTEDPDPADASEKKQIELYFDIRVSIDTDKKITFYKGDESFGSDKFDQFFDSFEWERQYELANKFFLGIDTNYNFGKFFIIKEGDLTYFKKLNQDLIEIDKSMIPQIYAQLDLDQQGEVNKILDEIDKGKYKGSPKISYENTNQYKVNNVTKNLKDVLAYLSFKQSRQNPSDFDMNLEAHLDYPMFKNMTGLNWEKRQFLNAIKGFQLKKGDENTVEVTYLSGKKVDMSRADFLKKYSQLPNIGNTQFNLLIAVVNRQEPLYTLLKELYNAKEITYNENGLTITSNDASVATKHITDISKIFDDFERLPEGTAQKIIKFILPTARIENILSQQDQSLQKNEQQLILGIEHVNKNGVSLTRLGVSDFEVYFTKENGHYSIYLKGGSYSLDKPFRTGLTTDEFINLCENTFETGEKAINDEKEKSVTDLLTEYNLPNHTQDEADPNKRIIDQILPLMMHLDTTRIAGHKSGKREYERALMIFNAKEIKVNGDIVTITSSVSDGIETLTLTDFKNKIISYYFDENGAEQTPATKLRQLLRRDIPNEEMKDLEAYFNTIMDKGITYNHLDKDVLDRLCKKYEEIELRFPYKFILHYYEGKHELQTPFNEFLEQIESTKMSDLSIKGHQPRITDSMANVRGVENEKGEIIRYDQKESGTHSPTCELEQDQNGGLTFKRDGKAQGILDVAKQFHHKNFLNVKKAYLDQINRDLSEKKTSYNSKQKIKKVRRSSGRGSGYSVYTGGGGGGGGGIIGGGGNTLTNFGNIFF